MKAVIYDNYQQPPHVTNVQRPNAPTGGAVLTVRATGVCRSDWHAWRGHDPVPLPAIPGHELAGVVAEVGAGVTRWRPGDRVTVPFVCGCGVCEYCQAGDAQVCPHQTQPGFTGPDSFAEQVAIHAADANLVALPDSIDFATAAALGCRFATAYRALTAHGRLSWDDWLAVHGCGGLSMSAVMIGVALGGPRDRRRHHRAGADPRRHARRDPRDRRIDQPRPDRNQGGVTPASAGGWSIAVRTAGGLISAIALLTNRSGRSVPSATIVSTSGRRGTQRPHKTPGSPTAPKGNEMRLSHRHVPNWTAQANVTTRLIPGRRTRRWHDCHRVRR